MPSDIFKNYILPTATLSGAIIGVGFFSLPYIALKVGIWLMLLYLIVLGTLVIFIHLLFGEIALKTPDFKRFPGFVRFHLGKRLGRFSLLSSIFGYFSVLLVYLIVGSDFLTNIFSPVFGGSRLLYVLIYFAAASLLVFIGIRAISKVELAALVLLFIGLLIIFIKGFFNFKTSNIFTGAAGSGIKNLFLPYGPIIFSLWGAGMIPEAEEMLGRNLSAQAGLPAQTGKKLVKRIIIAGILIPAIVYVSFIFLILGITGSGTTASALVGLRGTLGNGISSLAIFLGVMTTFVAFIALGLILKNIFMYDLGVKKTQAWLITCFTPLILFLLGLNSFIPLISFIGGVLLGIDGILILLMYKKIKGKNLLIYPLILIFVLGIIYQIIYFIK